MKKKLLYIIAIMLLITGCSNYKNNELKDTDSTETGITVDIEKVEEEKLDLENYKLEYKSETDTSSYFKWNTLGLSQEGCYYFDSNILKYIDFATKKSVYLCNQPDCDHLTEQNCNANYRDYKGVWFQSNMLQYYNGYIYMLGNKVEDSTEHVMLYKVSKDGSSREEYMELFRTEQNISIGENGTTSISGIPAKAIIHRGYVYYYIYNEETMKIRRIKLGDNKSEVIYSTSGERGTIYRLRAYGDYVFFQSGNFLDETLVDINAGIFAYNIHTGDVKLVKHDAVREYCVVGNKLYYYSSGQELRMLSLDTQEDCKLLTTSSTIFADDKYVYTFSRGGMLEVYNHQGEKIVFINDSNIADCEFGNRGILVSETKDGRMAILYIDDLVDKNIKWIYIDEYGVD